MKGKILFDIYPFKQGDIIEIPYENKNLEKIKGWQLWQVYEGDIDGYKGIVIVEKKYKGDYWKGHMFLNGIENSENIQLIELQCQTF